MPRKTDDRERDAEQLAELHHLNMIEFGRLIKRLRDTADQLEKNGHMTTGAYEAIEEMESLADTIGQEETEAAELRHQRVTELVDEGHSVEEALEIIDS